MLGKPSYKSISKSKKIGHLAHVIWRSELFIKAFLCLWF